MRIMWYMLYLYFSLSYCRCCVLSLCSWAMYYDGKWQRSQHDRTWIHTFHVKPWCMHTPTSSCKSRARAAHKPCTSCARPAQGRARGRDITHRQGIESKIVLQQTRRQLSWYHTHNCSNTNTHTHIYILCLTNEGDWRYHRKMNRSIYLQTLAS